MLTNESLLHELYFDRDFNCAESILRYFNTILDLGIDPDDLKLVAGFGGGMGCCRTCGALTGAIAALSKAKIRDRAHEDPQFRTQCGSFVEKFIACVSCLECSEIKKKVYTPEERCWKTVKDSAILLEDFLANVGGAE